MAAGSSDRDPSLDFEVAAFAEGYPMVIGVDEVGRGAIAGPVAVGVHAVLAGTTEFPVGLRDSKLLSEKRREALAPLVAEWGFGAVGYASAAEIDEHGITWALGAAGRRSLLALHEAGVPVHEALILVDGSHDWLSPALRKPLAVRTKVGADRAAHEAEPHYAWASNKGYGAKAHYEGIAGHGLSDAMHRRTWIK